MYDVVLQCTSQDAFLQLMTALNLALPDGNLASSSDQHEATIWMGRVVQRQVEIDADGGVVAEATYFDGEFAMLRASESLLDSIATSGDPAVVLLDEPPTGFPVWQPWQQRPAGPSLAERLAAAQESKILEAAAACNAALDPYASRFGILERETWPAQLAEAEALLADPTLAIIPENTTGWIDPIPTIRRITSITGEDIMAFAEAVRKNNEAWLPIAATAAGLRQLAVAEIKALTDPAAVAAYVINITL
jgi:hypothetical protein